MPDKSEYSYVNVRTRRERIILRRALVKPASSATTRPDLRRRIGTSCMAGRFTVNLKLPTASPEITLVLLVWSRHRGGQTEIHEYERS